MTQTGQNSAFRSRDAQEDSLTYHLGGLQAANNFRLLARAMIQEAEARGAAEQRRRDTEGSLRPMSEAGKNRTPILAKIHDDLFPRVYPERKDLKCWNGRWVVISHTGILADGFDIGWGMAAPVGHGGLTDDWFVGWKPVDCPANVAALEARVKVLEGENNTLKTRVINAAENLLSIETPCMKGDNFAVTICSYFEDYEGDTCDSGWHEGATKAYEEIKDAVIQHFRAALTLEGGV